MNALFNWLDHRTGYRGFVRAALFEHIPGGARWRYVWGSTLVFAFFVQAITGIVLWAAYSPSAQTAWESVYYIQHEMTGGWLLRGIHHFMAQAMIVLLALHLVQVIIDGSYRAPREVNFWIGIILALLVLGMSLTGYLLPWDQKGYWATKVATNLAGATPLIGPETQQVIVGGSDYGHHTLTRFFALHAGLLPALMIGLIVVHVYLFRRHGLHARRPFKKPDAYFWPDQVLRDGIAMLAVLAVVIGLCLWGGFQHGFSDTARLGAELTAPADPAQEYPARPEWYFLALFEVLKLAPAIDIGPIEIPQVVVGAFVIPGIVFALFMLMPLLGRWRAGHAFNVVVLMVTLLGAGALTGMALWADRNNPTHQAALAQAAVEADRAVVLARGPEGIPAQGAVELLRNDPKVRGPRLFAQYCASCHRYGGHDGLGGTPTEPATASDLKDFATKAWLDGLFDPEKIVTPHYFGGTTWLPREDDPATPEDEARKASKMVDYVLEEVPVLREVEEEAAQLEAVLWFIANEADLPQERGLMQQHAGDVERGREILFENDIVTCLDCHKYGEEGVATGPRLNGYRSRQWIIDIITDPSHVGYERLLEKETDDGEKTLTPNPKYPMPAFGASGQIDRKSIELLADWLRGQWYEPAEATPEPAPADAGKATVAAESE